MAVGGNPRKVVQIGHSRGAIATQAIGGYDDAIASLWRGQIAASHWDAATVENWPYTAVLGGLPGAAARARRLQHLPKFLTGECNLEAGPRALGWLSTVANVSTASVTATSSGFRDHTGFWIARPSPTRARDALRSWLVELLDPY